jgi:DNA processing protein
MPTVPIPSRRDLLIALNAAPEISRPAVYRLSQELDRWVDAEAPPERLAAAAGVPRRSLRRALAVIGTAGEAAARETAEVERLGGRIVTLEDEDYPASLRQLAPPPPVLYLRGEIPAGLAVAIVGSRRPDAYGGEAANLFARTLAAAGVTVVSGFARGIDAAAHRAALAAPDGRTVAVLGCGLGVDYPAGHSDLGREIAAGRGAVISELPCGAGPRAWHFPVRNRIIAALTAGTLVVQAAPRSGSLVTARHALDLGKEVWAVPGRIFDERSLGPNSLIRDGATLVQHPKEILESILPGGGRSALPLPFSQEKIEAPLPEPPPGPAGQVLAALLPGASRAPEELAAVAGMPVDQVLGTLLELELAGLVRRMPGGVYGR